MYKQQTSTRALMLALAGIMAVCVGLGQGADAQTASPPSAPAAPPADTPLDKLRSQGDPAKEAPSGPCGPIKVPGYKAARKMVTPRGPVEMTVRSNGSKERTEAAGRPTEIIDLVGGNIHILLAERKVALKFPLPPRPTAATKDPNIRLERKPVGSLTEVSVFRHDATAKKELLSYTVLCRNDGIYVELRTPVLTPSKQPFMLITSHTEIEISAIEDGVFEVPQDYKIETPPAPRR